MIKICKFDKGAKISKYPKFSRILFLSNELLILYIVMNINDILVDEIVAGKNGLIV